MSDVCTNGLDTGFIDLGYAKVAVLGVLQGITELLPISSTAHMRVVPAMLGWADPGSAFSAAMQLAALLAVITYFRHDVFSLLVGSTKAVIQRNWRSHSLHFALGIILGTIPIGLAGIALSGLLNQCDSPLRGLHVIGISCLVMAVLLALSERLAAHRRVTDTVTWRDCLIVGIAQVGALIPGISRSGSTLTAALFLGFTREDAAKFSFLLGLPAIALAGLKELAALSHAGIDAHGWSVLAVGLVVASISAFAAIWGLLKLLEKFSAWPFVIYRAALGILLLVAY